MENLDKYRKSNNRRKKRRKRTKIKKNRLVAVLVLVILFFFAGFVSRYLLIGSTLKTEANWVTALASQDTQEYDNTMISVINRENNLLEYVVIINQQQAESDFQEPKDLNLLFVPGETYLDTPGNDIETYMESYHDGVGKLLQTTKEYFGISIHNFIQVDQRTFEHLNHQLELEQQIELEELGYKFLDSGLERDEFQTKFNDTMESLVSFYLQVRNELGLFNRPAIRSYVGDKVETNLTWEELTEYIELYNNAFENEAFNLYTIPGERDQVNDHEYLVLDNDDLGIMVEQYFSGEVGSIPQEDITVEILNGCGIDGAATDLKSELEDQGFQVVRIGNADHFEYQSSQVIARTDLIEAAKEVALEISGADLLHDQQDDPEAQVTVIIGENYVQNNSEEKENNFE
ncbi:LCP family protein [Natranaerobius thermophilus]|uniref:LytR/CpsA/Psr regulator C-terminal domain-containing protein n=1 Tax=Natranaerobius thermophilus (strain ATCC BAA-1301 / DSM 18059 / JW/NM-WN-LF) TaxID=457570 RepID=B2A6C0_NATTJ|nr:LytR C-terminal domain-containing protein [Natranaerobius thermophilus]ACB84131.1 hypothetical protein Nther_0535 [Natranaerobius thermophilus JW/NM-WN-LF]